MSDQLALAPPLSFASRLRPVPGDEPFRWLAAGWQDFRRSRGLSAAYAFIFVMAVFWLAAGLAVGGLDSLILPLGAGLLLAGPAVAAGFHAFSRDIAAGQEPDFASAWRDWRTHAGPLAGLGLALLAWLAVWLLFAALVFALSFPDHGFDWQRALVGRLFTAGGLSFLGFGTAVGAVMAAVAFVAGAFSLPLMLERRMGVAEAVMTSAAAVRRNPRAMAVWAALVVLFTAAGLACWYVGLCLTLPLIGHASWHAYRTVIPPAG